MKATMLLALAIWLVPAVCVGQQPSDVPKYDEWRLVAQSDLILKAELIVPVDTIRASLESQNYSYVTLRVGITESLKGKPGGAEIAVRYYTRPAAYSPSPQAIIDLDRQEVLLFLIRSDDPAVAGLYLAGSTPKALQTVDPATEKKVRDEVQNQQRIVAEYRGSKAAQPDSEHQKVQALITQMLDRRTEMDAFNKLEQMGQAAVPSMIRLMDDRRPLPIQRMSLENNFPGAFEGIRHYGPGVVVDAVAALLNQITSESFGVIYNGGSERERAQAIAGWRIYLHYRLGKSNPD